MSNIKLGATLFCYGTEYARYQYDFEECVKQAALAGAEGYEIVATQMIPSYPNVSDDFLGLVNDLKAKYGIGPVGYGANNDKGMRCDRNLTDEEMLADTIIDLKAANKLGCKVMRSQYMLSPGAFEKLAPYAELYDIKVGIEIYNPETPISPLMKEYLEVIRKTGSRHLGFVPDFGCFAIAPNKPQWMKALKAGVKEEHLKMAADMRYAGTDIEETRAKLMEAGAHPAIYYLMYNVQRFDLIAAFMSLPSLFTVAGIFVTKNYTVKVGKKKMAAIGYIGAGIALILIYIVGKTMGYSNILLLLILHCIYGFFCFSFPIPMAMVPDAINYEEEKKGIRSDGTSYATVSLSTKFGSAFGVSGALLIMGATGYVANAQQTAEAMNGINMTTNLIFGIMFLCCLIPLFFYPLTEKKSEEILESLQKKRVERED